LRRKGQEGETVKRKLLATVIAITFILPLGSGIIFASSGGTIHAPSKVNVGEAFTLLAEGENEKAEGSYQGELRTRPYYYAIRSASDEHYWLDYKYGYWSYYSYSPPYTQRINLNVPGKYTIQVEFQEEYYDMDRRMDWEDTGVIYKVMKSLDVQGLVKFNANKGTIATKEKYYTYGSKYGKMPKAKRTGYKFLGWYSNKIGGSKIKASAKYTSKKATTTLYAHWEK
jgi:uncharacterized repeat protein (TIGR02543 family)